MRSATIAITVLGLVVLTMPAMAQEDRCKYTKDIDTALSVDGASEVSIEAGAGLLTVEGKAGSTETRVRGRVCAGRESWLEEMDVQVQLSGDRIEIETIIPEHSGSWLWPSRYAYIDLVVEVPASMPLQVNDGSGDLSLRDVAGGWLEDGSGDIEVHGVGGDLAIEDGSGDIDIRDAGSVTITDDGSGSISIADVTGSVVIDEDGSGSITVRRVGGNFTVHSDGSGGINHSEVGGKVDIPKQRGRR